MTNKDILECFYAGIENYNYYNNKHKSKKKKLYRLKYLIWLITLILFSPKKCLTNLDIYFIYGDLHEKIFSDIVSDKKVYLGLALNSYKKIFNNKGIMCLYSLNKRLKILIEASKLFFMQGLSFKFVHFWIEFYYIYKFLEETKPKQVNVAGHFDKYTTWISYISNKVNVQFNISQHGAIEKVDLPKKIYCSNFYVFNEYEKEFINNYLLLNDDCNFYIKGFKSHVKFQKYESSDNAYVIGIASQDLYTKETIKLVNFINDLQLNKKIEIIIYPHSRENINEYNKIIKENHNLKLYPKIRHKDLHVLVTFFSTIIYDYLESDTNIKLICFPPDNVEMSFFKNKKIDVVRNIDQLKKVLTNIIDK